MDKTKVKIETFLSNFHPRTEEDGRRILEYCHDKGLRVVLVKRNIAKGGKPTITFEEFVKWYNTPIHGDIIALERSGTIGIVKQFIGEEIVFFIMLAADGKFYIKETSVPQEPYRKATDEEKVQLQRELSRLDKQWDENHNLTLVKYLPPSNEYVRLTVLGEKQAYGIFREIKQGHIIMYVVQWVDGDFNYSMYEDVGLLTDFQFTKVSEKERTMITKALESEGREWNGHHKRIIHLDYRNEGGTYYYINDNFVVKPAEDVRPRNNEHFKSGNYFRSYVDAASFRDELIEIMKEYWLRWGPHQGKD